METTISIIGVGAMGGAVAEGLLSAGFPASKLVLADPQEQNIERFVAAGAQAARNNREAARRADIVILAVKPWLVDDLLAEIGSSLNYARQSLLVIAAGVSGEALLKQLAHGDDVSILPIAIVIPNIAVAVKQSMTFIVPVSGDPRVAVDLFNLLGTTQIITEGLLPAATSLASCGIAYAFRYIRAAMEGGVELGFKASAAQEVVTQTVVGAARLLERAGAHPETEIDKVTTPGGVTIRGLNAMEQAGFTAAVIAGLKASTKS